MVFALAALGLGMAGYLAFLHYNFQAGRFITSAACTGSGVLNCHAVALSHHAMFAGRPLAAWGAALYAIWVALALVGLGGEAPHRLAATRLIAVTALAAVVADAYLAWTMMQLHALCIWCALTYLVNIIVFALTWSALRAQHEPLGKVWDDLWLVMPWAPSRGSSALVPVLTAAWCMTLIGAVWGITQLAQLMTQGNPAELRKQVGQYMQQQRSLSIPTDGAPVRGTSGVALMIVEFSDFMCPACKASSTTVKAVLHNYAGRAGFAFKHYPLDHSCNPYLERDIHPGACRIAAAAACAHAQGKFWPMHDRIFTGTAVYDPSQLPADARAAGLDVTAWQTCLDDGTGLAAVQRDIEDAHRANITSTPTFVINGYVFGGGIPPAAFDVIAQELLHP